MKSVRELKNKKGEDVIVTTTWDDFSDYDGKLSQLLLEYDIPAMFYIPVNRLQYRHAAKLARELITYPYFDVGSHTINHALLTRIPKDLAWIEIADSKELLENKLSVPIRHFCYPRGYFDDEIAKMVEDAGYCSARTVHVLNTSIEQDPFAIKTTLHAYNRKEYRERCWVDIGVEYLEYVFTNGGYFHLWGHSAEINKYGDWASLEWFLSYINKKIHEDIQS